ncbi:MAG: hypothetical protein GXO65_03315 [Euryarchaeota archaeon]|nr:hypothetical protein [Euryarchaeota archaeon]
MRFVADSMLGRLARWLRMSGHDTAYPLEAGDRELLELAAGEGRVLLTRDRGLHRRAAGAGVESILIGDDHIHGQLRQLMEAGVEIRDTPVCSRCPACNGDMEAVEKGDVEGRVPAGVFQGVEDFWRCRDCGKVYWEGGHWEDIRRQVRLVRKDLNPR